MSIKQRVMDKLRTAGNDLLHIMKTGDDKDLDTICQRLSEAGNLCREGLPENYYTAYGEIYDGIILALQQMMENSESNMQEEVLSLCKELLQHLTKETKREEHFKKEVVFLPYKASMWDSLESVWKAAYEDKEHCNAYVIPIPYCDRNPDTSAAEWHCERDIFPKYVPTIDWNSVDLEKWHPDIIIFHNPYDERNNVTSVDSRFYSRNLVKCTDKLVYIPYFVLSESSTKEGVFHFVLTPGVISADLVVVQSEEMRQMYIDILAEATNIPDKGYWEKRISGIGSPKIDKVLTSRKEDFEMPEKWRKLVEGKKVILYNTSVSATLQYSDKVCDKLRYVFDVFRNRDDVVLWWRPHPLMKATFHSMRPQFEEEYLNLEKQYIEEGWGIYDDSPDLHRAICWSDAYYGDWSSVAQLYHTRKKFVFIQDLSGVVYTPYWFYNAIEIIERNEEEYFLIKPQEVERLYLLNINSGKCVIEIPFGRELFSESFLTQWNYASMRRIGQQIVIYPLYSKDWFLYEADKDILTKIYKGAEQDKYNIHGSIEYNGCLYFWSTNLKLWKFDPENKTIKNVLDWAEQKDNQPLSALMDAGCVVDDMLYIPLGHSGQVQVIDLKRFVSTVLAVGTSNDRYMDITTDGECLWLLKAVPEIEEYNIKTGEKHSYSLLDNKREMLVPYFAHITYTCNRKLLVFPCCEYPQATEVMSVSLATGEVQKTASNATGYGMVRRIRKDCNAAIDICKNNIDIYDDDGKLVHRCHVDMGNIRERQWYEEYLKSGRNTSMEKYNFSLQCFLDEILQELHEEQSRPIELAGEKIYKML